MTLLARVGEHLYWAARQLERAEGVARVVREHTHLLADMPVSVPLTWEPLMQVGGDPGLFRESFHRMDEASVTRFTVTSTENPESIASSVEHARENLRSCREVVPTEAWVVANDLHLYVHAHRGAGLDRRGRARLLERVIDDHQRFLGILLGNMSRDAAFTLMRLGRHIERAALTTRVLDVRAGRLLGGEDAGRYDDVQWIGVLRALSALHMYHRTAGEPVSAASAMRFLLLEPSFPRSVAYCMGSVIDLVGELPTAGRVMPACARVREMLDALEGTDASAQELHQAAHDLCDALEEVQIRVSETYFPQVAHSG
ncbi:MAG: alpha-E domain-containing protein [Thermoleophilia bacterium]|nr:alpha-E domain-containing protein [Thermoleophilia bacterium]